MRFPDIALFSKGFKGLPNGWKPISPITFVVGENSSGKTSLLDLVSLLDSSNFNLFSQFLGSVLGLDQANDVVTRFGEENEVTVGYIALTQELSQGEHQYVGLIVTAHRRGENLPAVRTSVVDGRVLVRIKRSEGGFESSTSFLSEKNEGISSISKWFESRHFSETGKFEAIENVGSMDAENDLGWLNAKLYALSRALNSKSKPRDFRTPQFMHTNHNIFSSRRYGPIRKEAQRIFYEKKKTEFDPSGSHYPYFLKSLSEHRSDALGAVKEFGRKSGLFENIRVAKLSGDGAEAFSILYEKFGREFHADELGYGLSQIIPIVTDLLTATPPYTFLIQQPEVHLHPKAQAAFGDLLHEVASPGCALIIETHSDFVIDRFRIAQAKSDRKIGSEILFFEKSNLEDRPTFTRVSIGSSGQIEGAPDSYREFFVNEAIAVFENL
jgi:predicted ATPase